MSQGRGTQIWIMSGLPLFKLPRYLAREFLLVVLVGDSCRDDPAAARSGGIAAIFMVRLVPVDLPGEHWSRTVWQSIIRLGS
jgi:hypothetical protein